MPADLIGGSYHPYDPVWTAVGRYANATQANIAGRTNVHWHGLGSLTEVQLVTTKQHTAAVPVEWGDVISKITIQMANEEGEAASESFGALYTGLPQGKKGVLITQSAAKTEALKKEALYTFTLAEPVLITPTNAPNGYVYASIANKATAPGKVAGWEVKPKAQLLTTNAPALSAEFAEKSATLAETEFTATATAKVPLFILS